VSESDELWRRARDALTRRGLRLPGTATPAEVARSAKDLLGDDRMESLVWNYIYPLAYGDGNPGLTQDQALFLVEGLEAGRKDPAPAPSSEKKGTCPLCHGPGNREQRREIT